MIGYLRTALLTLAVFAVARTGGAASETLRASAIAPCTDDRGFFEAVASRTERVASARAGEVADWVAELRVQSSGTSANGELAIRHGHDPESRRALTGESCESVVASLALVAALSIDPDAAVTLPPRPSALPPVPPPPLLPSPPPMPAPLPAARASEPIVLPSPALLPVPLGEKPPAPHRSATWHLGAGVDAAAVGMGALGATPDLAIYASLERDRGDALSPSLRLGAHQTVPATTGPATASGTFAWSYARAEGCPARVGHSVSLSPCAFVDVGALRASGAGSAAREVASPNRWWVSVGALGRLSLHAQFGPVAGDLHVLGGPLVIVTRDAFDFGLSDTVYRPPRVTAFGGAGLEVRFW